uniref:Ig-like domain-containing protein n=1 Tax=Oncorhynchus mykiss TaxID=8022 RepID=A0A8L0DNZ2_ONCMY
TFTRTRICALKGLSVDVSCTYRYPSGHEIIETEWYKWWNVTVGYTYNIMEQQAFAGRVEYLGNNHNDCTLKITDLRENDTADHNYSNSLHLCQVSSEDAGSYSCAVEGHENLHSPEVTLTVRYKPKNISVSIGPSGKIVEGSSVTLTCHSDANPPVQKYTWYKRNLNTSKESGQIYRIINIRSEDSGEYYCEAQNEMGAKNFTVRLIIVSGEKNSINIAVGITVVALVLILLFSFLWFRKRGGSSHLYDNISGMAMTPPAVQRVDTDEDGQGGSSHLYETILRTAPTAAQNADTDEDVRIYISVCPPPNGHPANLTKLWEALESTWASIPVECF